jgi:hypothetical protein
VVDTGDDSENGHWHLSRSIPLPFIVTMLAVTVMQTATAAWYISAMNYRVDTMEKAQVILAQQVSPQGERLTRVEEKLEGVKAGIADIKIILTAQDPRNKLGR